MCGIVGYQGNKPVAELLLNGLKRLEYRGYDSAGIAVVNDKLNFWKKKGKVSNLENSINGTKIDAKVGLGHTRWATHGHPSDENAHPHISRDGSFALVHNGIIENYSTLKDKLISEGYKFVSQTDTEVLVHLIHNIRESTGASLEESIRMSLTQVRGTYGIAVVAEEDDSLLIAARKGSPLILGVGDDEFLIASDASAIVEHTNQVVYLNDGEMVVIKDGGYEVMTIDNEKLSPEIHQLEIDLDQIEKGGYDHFMLKEIMEQPESLRNCMRGRIRLEDSQIKLGGLVDVMDRLENAKRFIICACGTSWHAGLVGEYMLESLVRVPVEVEYASEFRYRNPILNPEEDVVIVISQSGETADTLAAVREARKNGVLTIGICNAVGSTIARETDAGVYLHAGPEIGVASTKAFTAQVTTLALITLKLAQRKKQISDAEFNDLLGELYAIPDKIAEVFEDNGRILEISKLLRMANNFLYLGRGYNFPVALEGALKLKEISYIHAEGYPAAEMKHGPIALIDRLMPVVFIATDDQTFEKVVSNIEEVVARDGYVLTITDRDSPRLEELSEYVIKIPKTSTPFVPLLSVIPLQLLSYHIAALRGCDIDQPRNLAKSVTVE